MTTLANDSINGDDLMTLNSGFQHLFYGLHMINVYPIEDVNIELHYNPINFVIEIG